MEQGRGLKRRVAIVCVAKGCVGFLRVLEVEVGCCDVEREE